MELMLRFLYAILFFLCLINLSFYSVNQIKAQDGWDYDDYLDYLDYTDYNYYPTPYGYPYPYPAPAGGGYVDCPDQVVQTCSDGTQIINQCTPSCSDPNRTCRNSGQCVVNPTCTLSSQCDVGAGAGVSVCSNGSVCSPVCNTSTGGCETSCSACPSGQTCSNGTCVAGSYPYPAPGSYPTPSYAYPTPTSCTTPTAPTLQSPGNGTTLSGVTQVTLTWSAVSGAVSYDVRVDDNDAADSSNEVGGTPNNCTPHDVCINGWTQTSMTITVAAGKTYTWWVHAVNSCSQVGPANSAVFAVTSPGTIQGFKVLMPGNQAIEPAASQTVFLDGASPTIANPYFFTNVSATIHTVSVSVPAGYTVGYTLCLNDTTCHGNTPTSGSSVTVAVPAGGYADLWWHYTLQPGFIQGYKMVMPGNQAIEPAASQTVLMDGGSGTIANPYTFSNIPGNTNHTVSVTVPASYTVGYTLCLNDTTCHGNTPTSGSSVTVTVPAGGYTDLWWHYTPPPPTVSLSATSPIGNGTSTTLTWTIGGGSATSCAVDSTPASGDPTITSGNWSTSLTGADVTAGVHTRSITMTSASNATRTFNISCSNAGGTSPTASAGVTVNLPDLVVSSVTAPPTYIISGTNVSFSATVLNQGPFNGNAGASNTRFWLNTGVPFTDMSTNPLNSSVSQSLTTPAWTGVAGSYNLTVEADISGVVPESNEVNNSSGPFPFSVYAPLQVNCTPGSPSVLPDQNLTWNGTPTGGRSSTYTYTWTFTGSGFSCVAPVTGCESVEDPVVKYSSVGTKTATLRVADGGQTLTSASCSVDVNFSAWLKTTGGDVHSNTNISTPGGP